MTTTAKPPANNAVKLLLGAHQFYLAAELCDRQSTPDGSAWLIYPEVVNRAFACELALKGLIKSHAGESARGHDLEKLFFKLPQSLRDRVQWPETPTALFVDRLRDVKDTFELWRYAHEHDSLAVSVQFLKKLSIACIEVLLAEAAPDALMLKSTQPQEFFKAQGTHCQN